MDANRILPDLQSALLCEHVRREANGNFILIGILSGVATPQLPITAPQLCVFTRWVRGRGEFTEQVRLLDTDGTTEIRKCETQFRLQDPAHPVSNMTIFPQFEFKQQGVYQVEVAVDGVVKSRFPVPVVLVKPQGQPQPPADPDAPKENVGADEAPEA